MRTMLPKTSYRIFSISRHYHYKKVQIMTESVTEKGRLATEFWNQRRKKVVGFSLVAKYLTTEFQNSVPISYGTSYSHYDKPIFSEDEPSPLATDVATEIPSLMAMDYNSGADFCCKKKKISYSIAISSLYL